MDTAPMTYLGLFSMVNTVKTASSIMRCPSFFLAAI